MVEQGINDSRNQHHRQNKSHIKQEGFSAIQIDGVYKCGGKGKQHKHRMQKKHAEYYYQTKVGKINNGMIGSESILIRFVHSSLHRYPFPGHRYKSIQSGPHPPGRICRSHNLEMCR